MNALIEKYCIQIAFIAIVAGIVANNLSVIAAHKAPVSQETQETQAMVISK